MSAETSESDPRPELNSGSFRDRQKESDQQLPVELLSDLQDTLGEGAELFLVGGALRDLFLKRSLGDVDLATNLLPQELTCPPPDQPDGAELGAGVKLDRSLPPDQP